MPAEVDVILLRRDASPPPEPVRLGLDAQRGVRLVVHRVVGARRADDPNRWATIARARNLGKSLGTSPYVLFLDDDVILGAGCVARLVDGLSRRPDFAAVAADYLGESAGSGLSWDQTPHVGMGATLFRRDRLAPLTFRWSPGRCECRCACDDLRRAGFAVGYLPGAEATHAKVPKAARALAPAPKADAPGPSAAGRILTAFDRNHLRRFRGQFLGSLRSSGNRETVTAVVYGLYPSERRALAMLPGVEVHDAGPSTDVSPSRRRLDDFQAAIAGWPEETPVAYWDAGDILFQGRLAPLWRAVLARPDRLLAVAEPLRHPENGAVLRWTRTIVDPDARRRAVALLTAHPYLNGGFAAGTVRAVRRYLDEASRYDRTAALKGSADWGDQTALNLYCHTHPDAWHALSPAWNYCLCGRRRGDILIRPDGHVAARDGTKVVVVHGNARRLRHTEMSFLG